MEPTAADESTQHYQQQQKQQQQLKISRPTPPTTTHRQDNTVIIMAPAPSGDSRLEPRRQSITKQDHPGGYFPATTETVDEEPEQLTTAERIQELVFPTKLRELAAPFLEKEDRLFFYKRYFVALSVQLAIMSVCVYTILYTEGLQELLYREKSKGSAGVVFMALWILLFVSSCVRQVTDNFPVNFAVPMCFPFAWAYLICEYASLNDAHHPVLVGVLVVSGLVWLVTVVTLFTEIEPLELELIGNYLFVVLATIAVVINIWKPPGLKQTRIHFLVMVWGAFPFWLMLFLCLKRCVCVTLAKRRVDSRLRVRS